jgi:hypothetical protein
VNHWNIDPRRTILFVGAGVSMQLKLPSWSVLIGDIGVKLGYDPDIFRDFSTYWGLAEYYKLKQGDLTELAAALKKEWHRAGVSIEASGVHRAIAELGFSRIYTTNFDHWLEEGFIHWSRAFHKVVRVSDIGVSASHVTEIVKFHGDLDDPETLVLTESSYFDRLEFESPLDIMLRADALQRPILFVGYSLGDMNMRYLFHKLHKQWIGAQGERIQNFIFMTQPNPIEEALFERWNITPIVDQGGGLADFLESLR